MYLRERDVPIICPVCDWNKSHTEYRPVTLGDLISTVYLTYSSIRHKRHPFWGMPYWEGRCGNCEFRSQMTSPRDWIPPSNHRQDGIEIYLRTIPMESPD